jgi:hypothetical protein
MQEEKLNEFVEKRTYAQRTLKTALQNTTHGHGRLVGVKKT